MKGAFARFSARTLADRVVEGRPTSRLRSVIVAAGAGAAVAVAVYRVLRSGGGRAAGEGDDGDHGNARDDGDAGDDDAGRFSPQPDG